MGDARDVFPGSVLDAARFVVRHGFRTVCLQVPDDELPGSVSLVRSLENACAMLSQGTWEEGGESDKEESGKPDKETGGKLDKEKGGELDKVTGGKLDKVTGGKPDKETGGKLDRIRFFVIADAVSGRGCCVDEVSAKHVNADCLVHFGHTCMSHSATLPVVHVLPRRELDTLACANALVSLPSLLGTPKAHLQGSLGCTGNTSSLTTGPAGAKSEPQGSMGYPWVYRGPNIDRLVGMPEAGRATATVVVVLCALEYAHLMGSVAAELREGAKGGSGGRVEGRGGRDDVDDLSKREEEEENEEEAGRGEGSDDVGLGQKEERGASGAGGGGGARQLEQQNVHFVFGALRPMEHIPRKAHGPGQGLVAATGTGSFRGTGKGKGEFGAEFDSTPTLQPSFCGHEADSDKGGSQKITRSCGAPGCCRQEGLDFTSAATRGQGGGQEGVGGGLYSDRPPDQSPDSIRQQTGALQWWLPRWANSSNTVYAWIGPESPSLTSLVLPHNAFRTFRYDPDSAQVQELSPETSRLLRRRYYLVEKAKEASIVGIVVSSLGNANVVQTVTKLRTIIAKAGKKAYTIVMGKLSPTKLANFPECEVMVVVGCPESVVLDSKEYYVPLITPFEAELAFVAEKEWTGEYRTDDVTDGVIPETLNPLAHQQDSSEGSPGDTPESLLEKSSEDSPVEAPGVPPAALAAGVPVLGSESCPSTSLVPAAAKQVSAVSNVNAVVSAGYASGMLGLPVASGSEFLAQRRAYKGLEVPWFMEGSEAVGQGGWGVQEKKDAESIKKGTSGRAAVYVGEGHL